MGSTLIQELEQAADEIWPGPVLGHETPRHKFAARLRARAALAQGLADRAASFAGFAPGLAYETGWADGVRAITGDLHTPAATESAPLPIKETPK